MSVALRVFITGSLREGVSADDFRAFGSELQAIVAANEPGTTVYNWWVGEDGTVINEDGYADEASFFAHMGAMQESGNLERWMSMVEPSSVQVLGQASDGVRELAAGFGAVHYGLVSER
jgi:hypothetical protein